MTRKIEREMNAAISNNLNWSKDNTRVEFDPETGESKVYLHGNHIADVGENYVRLFDGGWQSNTTKSRINAILGEHGISGEGVFQKNYQWFIRLYNGTEFFVTEFRNGMKLGDLPYSLLLAWGMIDPCTIALNTDKQLMDIHTQDNIIDRDELQANYINTILDGMDIKDMMRILYDQFDENLDKYTVDELIGEVKEYYPELLGEW